MDIDLLNEEFDHISEREYGSKEEAWDKISSLLEQHGITTTILAEFVEDEFYYKMVTNEGTYYLYADLENVVEEGIFVTILPTTELDLFEQILTEGDDNLGE
jgi:mannitol/fructose-specific phosphotransferase system IIA component (Ntr-type)